MLKIRRPLGRLIFNMGIAIPGKTVFLIETAPCIVRHLKQVKSARRRYWNCHWTTFGLTCFFYVLRRAVCLCQMLQDITWEIGTPREYLSWHQRNKEYGNMSSWIRLPRGGYLEYKRQGHTVFAIFHDFIVYNMCTVKLRSAIYKGLKTSILS